MRAHPFGVLVVLAAAALIAPGCASGGGGGTGAGATPVTRRVPRDYATIQAAVDASHPGDTIAIAAGTYREGVVVETDGITLRGDRRDAVVIEGGGKTPNGIAVYARAVTVERLTVANHRVNGVLVAGDYGTRATARSDYRIREVTATGNGLYGIYAFGVRGGVIERSEASGSPDSGIYIGQCDPCDAVVRDNVATRNRVGYEGTNATGVRVEHNRFESNRVGLISASGDQERLAPQHGAEIVDNVVRDNRSVGIVIAGGSGNVVKANEVRGHPDAGIVITDQDGYVPDSNRVRGNVLANSGLDLVLAATSQPFDVGHNCFEGNGGVASTLPALLEDVSGCGSARSTVQVPNWSPPPDVGS